MTPTNEDPQRDVAMAWRAVEQGTRAEYQLAAIVLRRHGVPMQEIERRHLEAWRAT